MTQSEGNTARAISVTVVHHLLDLLAWQGMDEKALLQSINRTRETLDDGGGWVSVATGVALINAVRQQRDEALLFLRASHHTFATGFGVVGHLLQACPTLKDAIEALIRFEPLITDIGRSHFRYEGDAFLWGFYCEIEDEAAQHQITDFIMGARYRFLMLVQGSRDQFVREVRLVRPAPDTDNDKALFQKIFHCPVYFSQHENLIVMSADAPALSLRQADSSLKPIIEEQAQKKLDEMNSPRSIQEAALKAMRELLQEGNVSRDLLAARLGVSSRHLHRQLEAEGSSYRELLDGLRLEMAKQALPQTDISIESIAARLGFADGQSFSRWFKQTTTQTPREYRDALLAKK